LQVSRHRPWGRGGDPWIARSVSSQHMSSSTIVGWDVRRGGLPLAESGWLAMQKLSDPWLPRDPHINDARYVKMSFLQVEEWKVVSCELPLIPMRDEEQFLAIYGRRYILSQSCATSTYRPMAFPSLQHPIAILSFLRLVPP